MRCPHDVGDEQGRPYNAALFEPLLKQWLCGQLAAGIPGGEDGHNRFAVLDDATTLRPAQTLAVVSHGGTINAVIGSLIGHTYEPSTLPHELPPCGMAVLTNPDSQWELSALESA